jgi:CBS domain-containing protein
MTATPLAIDAAAAIGDVLASHFGEQQRHRAVPVVRGAVLVGMLDKAALAVAQQLGGKRVVGDLYGVNLPIFALAGETCRSVATRPAVHQLERLPVVDNAEARRLVGLVSRSDLIKASLTLHEGEHQRQAFRHIRLGSAKRPM